MSDNNQHKPGYKHTPLGWIPEEWEIYPVGKAFNICNNLRFPISENVRNDMSGLYPYYGPTKIQGFINEYRVEGKYALIGEDGDHFLKWKELPMTLLVDGKFNVNNHAHLIQGNGIGITEWFFYYFNHRELTTYLTRQGAGRYKLTKAALSKMPIPMPSLDEQRKIATILSTWDEAITKVQQLIAQLQQRNKGLMQQLLRGKKRLKGFEGEWKKIAIGDVLFESRIPSTDNKPNKRITVRLNHKGVEKREVRGTEAEDATYYFIRKKGQFIYGKQNLHKGAFGIIPDFLDRFESSQDIPAFDFKDGFHPQFFIYYLGQDNIFPALEKYATGTGSKRIHPENLFKVHFNFPDFEEQEAIAHVLDAAVNQVKLYEQKRAALQQQKKGLMQKLLTGEVRVK